MQVLYVMQGPSGGGKSTVARQLQQSTNAEICSTDNFHMVDGKYVFQAIKLADFHKQNLEQAKKLMDEGKTVIVDNTNIRRYEPKGYVQHAVSLGIPVIFIRVDGNFQNTHGVPQDKVDLMRKNMETLTVESVLASRAPWEKPQNDLVH